ncbi:MAG: hypothetical protein K6A32_00990 [Bacteroidales bacterium]|nr:hypothetical protein [Bacteroidales bacterium]
MKTIKILRYVYIALLVYAALLAIGFETNVLEAGVLAGDDLITYWLSLASVAHIIVLLPVALRLMKFKRVQRAIAENDTMYLRWGLVRLLLLGGALLFNTLTYYLLGFYPTCGYLALMALVAFLFVWPSKDNMTYEQSLNEYSKE